MSEKISAEQLDAVAELISQCPDYGNGTFHLLNAMHKSTKMESLIIRILQTFYSAFSIGTDETQVSILVRRLLMSGILLGYAVRQTLMESPKSVS